MHRYMDSSIVNIEISFGPEWAGTMSKKKAHNEVLQIIDLSMCRHTKKGMDG